MFNLKEISLVIIVNFCFFPASRDPIPNMCRVGWPSFSSYKRTNSLHCYQREKLLEIERERGHGIRIAGDITASVWFSEKTDSKCIFCLFAHQHALPRSSLAFLSSLLMLCLFLFELNPFKLLFFDNSGVRTILRAHVDLSELNSTAQLRESFRTSVGILHWRLSFFAFHKDSAG